MRKNILLIMSATLLVGSCTKSCGGSHASMSPEDVVQAYLDVAFNLESVDDRQKLLEFTTGPMKDAIATASDVAIREAYVEPRYELKRYSVIERRDRTPRESEITFEIEFRNLAREGGEKPLSIDEIPVVTVENTVSVVREKKLWLISDVLNKKSSFMFPTTVEGTEIKPTSN
jgi:hypothetical protein